MTEETKGESVSMSSTIETAVRVETKRQPLPPRERLEQVFDIQDLTAIYGSKPALKDVSSPVAAFALITVALAIVSFYTSISGLIKAEMFPPEVRAMGVGLSYAVANALFGGSAEYVALWFKSIGHEAWFSYYLTAVIATSLVVYVTMRDTRRQSRLTQDSRPA